MSSDIEKIACCSKLQGSDFALQVDESTDIVNNGQHGPLDESRQSGAFPCHLGGETAGCHMISGAGLCWQHVGGVGSTTTTTLSTRRNS